MAKKKKQKLTKEFIDRLAEISAGYLSVGIFDELISLFESEINKHLFTKSSEANLLRMILNRFDKTTFLHDCVKYPHYTEILISIAANSNYLTDILVRDPEYFYWIVNPSILNLKLDDETFFIKVKETANKFNSFNAKLNAIRSLKRKEILRIGVKDIWGNTNLKEITEELSILAKGITQELFSLCLNEVKQKNKIENLKSSYCIVSLGKLGGGELNYSSDIDLLIFFDKNYTVTKHKNYSDILTDAILLFIKAATSITEQGFIFRVDFRLRPDGKNSPLCKSLADYLLYYESRGEDWERQMLIKAGFAGGNKELYNKFISSIQPFVFPVSFTQSPVEQIKKMKKNIERHLTDEENIKLTKGGIRDIEFSVQALQLLNGGKNKDLKTGNTLKAINNLFKVNLISEDEKNILKNNYIFYRKIEHYLQLMNDKQTHSIPQEGELVEKISGYMGYKNLFEFKSEVNEKRKEVINIYNSIMGIDNDKTGRKINLSKINVNNRTKAERDLLYLREGKGLLGQRQFDKKSIEAFNKIEKELFDYLKKSFNPDLTLQNFVRVIRFANFPSMWYDEFTDRKFFKSFLTICEFSQRSIDLFAEDKEFRESLLTREVFSIINEDYFSKLSIKKILFILSVQYSLKIINSSTVSKTLSRFIKSKISEITRSKLNNTEFMIAGMGSFGNNEITFASDIDLIFVTSNINNDNSVQKEFQNLLNIFKKELKPFEVDCRLRPEGKSSQLVWNIIGYENYLNSRARIWELQAFCKIDFVCGDKKLFNKLIDSVNKRIENEKKDEIKKEIDEMRKKLYPVLSDSFNIKKSPGGITDIEYVIQYLILCNPKLFKKCIGKGTINNIKSLTGLSENFKELEILKNNFKFLKELELTNQNTFNSSTGFLPKDGGKIKIISKVSKFDSVDSLNKKINEVIKSNINFYKKFFRS